jgi:trimeric autotransporter adhesin
MPIRSLNGNTASLAKLACVSLALQGCLTNSPKAVVTDASVTESKIAGSAVTSDKIQNGTIGTVDLADSSVTTAKIASGVNITGGSSTWTGSVSAATGLTVAAGGATITAGNLTVSSGNLSVTGTVGGTGNFTIGDSASADAHTVAGSLGISFSSTSIAGADVIGITNAMTASPTAASDSDYKAIRNILTGAPTAAVNAAASYTAHENQLLLSPTVAQPNLTGWGSVNIARLETPFATNQLVGTFGRAHNSDSNTLATGIGVDSEILNDTNGTITNGYAFHAKLDNQGGGTVTNYVGLYLQDPADPNNAAPTAFPGGVTYGVFSDGAAAKNFFEGNVGMGVSNPTFKLDVNGTVRLQGISGETNGNYLCVEASGEITNGGASCASSDARLKKDILPIKDALDKILALKGVSYKWKEPLRGDSREIGLIAQDVLTQFPEAVNKNAKGFLQVNYDGLVGPLVESIKELYVKLTSASDELKQQKLMLGQLERRIELENIALKSENKQLKARLDKIEQALASALPPKEEKKGRKLASH